MSNNKQSSAEQRTIMVTPIRFKSITNRGKVVSKTIKINIPNGLKPMEYLDNIDKINILEDNDWGVIIDYWVVVDKPKKENVTIKSFVEEYFKDSENREKIVFDFMLVYSRIKNELKGLKPELQFKLVLKTMNVGYDAASEAYRYATKLIKSIGDEDIQKELGFDKRKEQLKLKNNN